MSGSKIHFIVMFFIGVILTGCSMHVPPPEKIEGLYPDNAKDLVKVKSSNTHYSAARDMPFTYDDVFQATADVLFSKGMIIEKQDREKGIILGKGSWPLMCGSGPCYMSLSFIAYIEEINDDPTTKLTFAIDRYGFSGNGGEVGIVTELMGSVQKMLITY